MAAAHAQAVAVECTSACGSIGGPWAQVAVEERSEVSIDDKTRAVVVAARARVASTEDGRAGRLWQRSARGGGELAAARALTALAEHGRAGGDGDGVYAGEGGQRSAGTIIGDRVCAGPTCLSSGSYRARQRDRVRNR